jgi:Flp pilus assembly protein TadB
MGLLLALCCASLALMLHRSRPGSVPGPAREARARRGPPLDAVRLARPAAALLGVAVAVVVHPVAGLVVGALGWRAAPGLLARLESSGDQLRRERLARQLPLVAELLAACLAAGTNLAMALRIVAEAVPEPSRSLLDAAARCAALGGSAPEVAGLLADPGDPGWQALSAAITRSADSGAPLSTLLTREAERSRSAWTAGAAARARAMGVRIVLPLAACSLPAFVLLTVVPVVAGFLSQLSM